MSVVRMRMEAIHNSQMAAAEERERSSSAYNNQNPEGEASLIEDTDSVIAEPNSDLKAIDKQ